MQKLLLFTFIAAAYCCTSGTYPWLGQCCTPDGSNGILCPPGVPVGNVKYFNNPTKCLQVASDNTLELATCANLGSQTWSLDYVSNQLRLRLNNTNLCVTRSNTINAVQTLANCDFTSSGITNQWIQYEYGLLSNLDSTWCLAPSGGTIVQILCGDEPWINFSAMWINSHYLL
jgi:hypothetical protein